jgi:hypothetical protein
MIEQKGLSVFLFFIFAIKTRSYRTGLEIIALIVVILNLVTERAFYL